jgi:short-subunit dehydrogenase
MLAPIELIKATVDGMVARGFGRIVNITSGRREVADRESWACRMARAAA